MAQDITGIIRTLRTSAVNRCRERINEAALRAKGLITRGGGTGDDQPAYEKEQYGVSTVLKRRHGL